MSGISAKTRPCKKCGRNRSERFFVSARGHTCLTCRKKRVAFAGRDVRLLEAYGITLDEYASILEAQGGVCAICGGERTYNLDVDHDHALGSGRQAVRGLLCKACNRRLLPAAKDSPDNLLRAIEYLRDPPARKVLSCT